MKKIIAICFVLSSIALFGQEITTLSLTGTANKKVQPDRFIVNVDLKAEGKTQKESFTGLNDLSTFVLNQLKSLSFSQGEIKLNNYSVYTKNVATEKSKQDIRYYTGQIITIDFKLDKERILRLYDTLLNNEKKGISISFSTSISDSLRNLVYDELIVRALYNAQKKAELISSTSKLKIRSIKSISYNATEDYNSDEGYIKFTPPMMKTDDEVSSENANCFSIEDITLSDEVKVTYNLEK